MDNPEIFKALVFAALAQAERRWSAALSNSGGLPVGVPPAPQPELVDSPYAVYKAYHAGAMYILLDNLTHDQARAAAKILKEEVHPSDLFYGYGPSATVAAEVEHAMIGLSPGWP